ncbi:MAG: 3-phosphoshikimate 1-carboxyvinyltransferase [Zavarzinella sp.]
MFTYPAAIQIPDFHHPVTATVRVPGSKSISNRALILAAAGQKKFLIRDILRSEDTELMVAALASLGWSSTWVENDLTIFPRESHPAINPLPIHVGNSGTTIRFLTAFLALYPGCYLFDGIPRMRERPIEDLLDALRQLNVDVCSARNNGCPPVELTTNGLHGGTVRINGERSSQFLTALLLALPFATGDSTIIPVGKTVSEPYLEMTLRMLQQFGISVSRSERGTYLIPGSQQTTITEYAIEPDASSASYWFAMAAITQGSIKVTGLNRNSLQGDHRFVDVLEQMGCRITSDANSLTVNGQPLRGIDVDMNAISDTVMTLAVVACFATGPTRIRNVEHIRFKETDRLKAICTEMQRLGVQVEEKHDEISIFPGAMQAASLETYNDHRMAMSLALAGIRIPGVIIQNPGCVVKTYPGYWQDWQQITGTTLKTLE